MPTMIVIAMRATIQIVSALKMRTSRAMRSKMKMKLMRTLMMKPRACVRMAMNGKLVFARVAIQEVLRVSVLCRAKIVGVIMTI